MIFGVTCPACGSATVRLGPRADSTSYSLLCCECQVRWSAPLPLGQLHADGLTTSETTVERTRPRLLVLDDDQHLAVILGTWLTDLGDVHTATTSAQALVLASVIRPQLALLDIVLPRMDGFEVLEALRRVPGLGPIPVILMTGSARPDIAVRASTAGAADLLFKPLDEERVRSTVHACLAPIGRH
jgi:CheY-like chemotaxis protein